MTWIDVADAIFIRLSLKVALLALCVYVVKHPPAQTDFRVAATAITHICRPFSLI